MILSPEQITKLHNKFSTDGVAKVRQNLANSIYGAKSTAKAKCATEWVDQQEVQKSDEAQARSEAREEQNIELAKDAKSHSKIIIIISVLTIVVLIIGVLIAYFKP